MEVQKWHHTIIKFIDDIVMHAIPLISQEGRCDKSSHDDTVDICLNLITFSRTIHFYDRLHTVVRIMLPSTVYGSTPGRILSRSTEDP